jgi:hypothetical protein
MLPDRGYCTAQGGVTLLGQTLVTSILPAESRNYWNLSLSLSLPSIYFFKTGYIICATKNRESSAGIAVDYGLDGRGLFPGRGTYRL